MLIRSVLVASGADASAARPAALPPVPLIDVFDIFIGIARRQETPKL